MACSLKVSAYRSSESPRSQSAISKSPPELALPARVAHSAGTNAGAPLSLIKTTRKFRRLGTAGVPVDDMNIVGAFIKGLSRCQGYLFSTLHLHHDGAFQYVNRRMCIVSVDRARPAGRMLYYDHQHFLAGILRKSFDMSDVTLAC